MTPSDFMKVALERALQQREIIAKERQHALAYLAQPQQPEEIEEWQDEQEHETNISKYRPASLLPPLLFKP